MVGAAVVAALFLAPCAVAYAQEAPTVEPPVEPPVVTPPTAADNPPLVSEPIVYPPSVTPEGDFDVPHDAPLYTPPAVDLFAMSDADRFAYLAALSKQELDQGLAQWGADFLANSGGSGNGSSLAPAVVAAAAAAATAADGSWTQLTQTIVDRRLVRPASADVAGRSLSNRLSIRYETPLTTGVSFVVVNGSSSNTTVTVTWRSGTAEVSERVAVASGTTVESVLTLPAHQDLAAGPGSVTATFTAPAESRDVLSFVALASATPPQDLPESRGYSTSPR